MIPKGALSPFSPPTTSTIRLATWAVAALHDSTAAETSLLAAPNDWVSPEDWVASATTRFGQSPAGLTALPDGRYLRNAIEQDPGRVRGPKHVASFGPNPAVLVKLLDAASRLGVHIHPDDDFARRHLGCGYGKTEAWVFLTTVGEGCVWVGFTRRGRSGQAGEVAGRAGRGPDAGALHRVPVREGSAVLVPAGVPHTIGAGVLVLELQQPTDFSIMLERAAPEGGDLGLGSELALQAVDRSAWTRERLQRIIGPGVSKPGPILPPPAEPFFRTEFVAGAGGRHLEPGIAVVVGIAGTGELNGESRAAPSRCGVAAPFLFPSARVPQT